MLSKSITNFVVTFPVLFKRSFGTQVYSGLELGFSTRKTDNFWGGPQNGNTGKMKKGRVARGGRRGEAQYSVVAHSSFQFLDFRFHKT